MYSQVFFHSQRDQEWTCRDTAIMEFDFQLLASKYPDLNQYYDNDTHIYDFHSHELISLLTHYILLHYFQLQVPISKHKLCPRIPNRILYLQFINDFICGFDTEGLRVIDIGTGYCAIYLLLLLKLSKWELIGTEIDQESIRDAEDIIELNNLQNRIHIVKAESDVIVPTSLIDTTTRNVVICNPPFYCSIEELTKSQLSKRTLKRSELRGSESELVCEGGEYGFLNRMLQQNLHNTDINWFTSLVGKHETTLKLLKKFRALGITNYFVTSLMDDKSGRTQRWIIGWSFLSERIIIESTGNGNVVKLPMIGNYHARDWITRLVPIECEIDNEGCLLLDIKKDVWSRKYRRGGGFIEVEDGIKCKISKDGTKLYWTYGLNSTLFQRFTNHLQRLFRNTAK